ncbi:MAG: M1 family metallopeptidase [Methylococcales bacterium]|nr:M1 family metallopeptidase [Methylococcales bacterium]
MPVKILSAVLLAICVQCISAAQAPTGRIVLPATVTPLHYTIDINPDSTNMRFSGEVKIDLKINTPTQAIVLNAVNLEFQHASLSDAGAATVNFDEEQQTATLTFAKNLAVGKQTLAIRYTGMINQNAAGLFLLDYNTAAGKKRALFTHFENSEARRMFPCWDEPGLKATFDLSIVAASNDFTLSNTPIKKTEALAGGLKKVHFATSPAMSTYLLFFGIGDYERVTRVVDGVDIGVIVKRGDTAKAHYALDTAAQILPYLQHYFGVQFPLPKLDLLAAPGQSQTFGAMENWGAIFYFENVLLVDPALTTESDRRRIFSVIAHEMAHQWFGDLVTMAWWDDLWLNEGFASWMAYKVSDHFHPEWKVWMDAQNATSYAMLLDARAGTHPIIQPINDVLQANQAFDSITYQKGSAVIRMLETYIGEKSFRAGVRNYIRTHAYGNAVTDDLWHDLDHFSSTKIIEIAHDFTKQAGIPLVDVSATEHGWRLTQARFANDDSTPADRSWHVPVNAHVLAADITGSDNLNKQWQGVLSRTAARDVPGNKQEVLLVNSNQTGYYRTRYSPQTYAALVKHFVQLSPPDQLGLLNDSRELGYSGYAPLTNFLSLVDQVSPEMDATVLKTIADRLVNIDYFYTDLPGQKAYRAYARDKLQPVYEKLGWAAQTGENTNFAKVRSTVLQAMAQFDDAKVLQEANNRFADFLKDKRSLSSETRKTVLSIIAAHAAPEQWQQLHELAKQADSPLEQQQMYGLLGMANDRSLATKAMQLSLDKEVIITTRPIIIRNVAKMYPELAFDFIVTHHDAVMTALEPGARTRFVPGLAGQSYETTMIDKLDRYAEGNIPASARQSAVKAIASIKYYSAIRKDRIPEVDRWLNSKQKIVLLTRLPNHI